MWPDNEADRDFLNFTGVADSMRASGTKCSMASLPSCPDADVSSVADAIVKVVDAPSASGLSGCISTRRKTARKSSTQSRIVSGPSFYGG
jgi:hypothetical protein